MENWSLFTAGGALEGHWRYAYNGWDVIAEVDMLAGAVSRKFWWQPGGLGGAGRLLQYSDATGTFLAGHDGKGNLTTLSEDINANPVLAREYSPYGQIVRETNENLTSFPNGVDCPIAFKGEFLDRETGLIYHGHRYYSPALARFLSRDPLGERDGPNIYAFARNDPVNGRDLLGLCNEEPLSDHVFEMDEFVIEAEQETVWDWYMDLVSNELLEVSMEALLTEFMFDIWDDLYIPDDHELLCAGLAADLTSVQNMRPAYGGDPAPGYWIDGDPISDKQSGFNAVWVKGLDGPPTLSIAGTNPWDLTGDMKTNASQNFGYIGAQYRFAQLLLDDLRNKDFNVVGHSLGGGLGSAIGTALKRPTVTLNASGIHDKTLDHFGITRSDADNYVRAIVVNGDGLNRAQDDREFLTDAIGRRASYDPDISTGDRIRFTIATILGLNVGRAIVKGTHLHSIEEGIEAIEKQRSEHGCN